MGKALWAFDEAWRARGFAVLCGVDEAGRGPLAGPVFAAAVILGKETPGVRDSKKLTPKRRDALFDEIVKTARAYAVASASVEEIERLNILGAAQLAMRRAVSALGVTPDLALVDGNVARQFPCPVQCVIQGDDASACIAAASILAKVERDRAMIAWARVYPEYGFERHKGYPTKAHYERIAQFGPSPIHRLSFLTKFLLSHPDMPGAHV